MVDDRSPAAKAMDVVSQIMSIAFMGVLPALMGYGLDSWFQSNPICTLLGGMFGLVAAGYQLTRLVHRLNAGAMSGSDE